MAWMKAVAACAAFVIGVSAIGGAPASAQPFKKVLSDALGNSPDVRAQRQSLRQLDEAVAVARGTMRPSVSASASVSGNSTDRPTIGETTTTTTSIQLDASQRIFDGWQTDNAIAAAEANVQAGRLQLISVEQSVLLSAIEAYVGVIQAQQNLRLARRNVTVIRKQLDATKARLDVGEVTRTDVAQAEAALASSRANLRTREGELQTAANEFRRVVGYAPRRLAALPPLPVLPRTLREAEEVALNRSPTYLAAVFAEKAARFGADEAFGALLPQVSFSTNVTASSTNGFADDSTTVSGTATVTVTVPLYSGGVLRSSVRSNLAVERQRAAERVQTMRNVRRDVANAWQNFRTARSTIVANAEQVEASRVAFRGVQEEARVGSRTTLDVLNEEQNLLDAQVALVNSRSDQQVAAYRLLLAMGTLRADALGLKVERYDPVKPYEKSQRFDVGYPSAEEDDDKEWMKRY